MDKEFLVSRGQMLIGFLDNTELKPRAAVWVNFGDTGSWKLWIVPIDDKADKRNFYRVIASTISEHISDLKDFDSSFVELVKSDQPAIRGLSKILRIEGLGDAHLTANTFDGYYLPDGIILRMAV